MLQIVIDRPTIRPRGGPTSRLVEVFALGKAGYAAAMLRRPA